MNTLSLANTLGFLALFTYITTLLPTILKIIFPRIQKIEIHQFLCKYRRFIGILTFFFALGHGFLMIQKRNFDVFDTKTYWIYLQGIVTLIIFTLLAITSNNWSVRRLKKNWKKLHRLTYLAIFILIWHILDKMSGKWTYLTPIGIVAIAGTIFLFFIRIWIEYKNKQKKQKVK
ncbi:ferric reductase-like transmembrane domain-containing protein [Mastigocoleus testarum]|uniref:Iron reductase n=1 Tax=Mastigocoleus testarum BC008 TaxID=371196 RepID=A0A0V7ZL10_9CYAN|nr:ferric reductase-like transmembrane domain-containing protein [Mastigocoleus testarum]KST65163.1 iron reductase [Mastigocoleus testarum BC008]